MVLSSGPRKRPLHGLIFFVLAFLIFSVLSWILGDPYESDDTAATARRFGMDAPPERHDFDKIAHDNWIYFFVHGNLPYTIEATSVSAACDVTLAVYADTDSSPTLLRFADDRANGKDEFIHKCGRAAAALPYRSIPRQTMAKAFTAALETWLLLPSVILTSEWGIPVCRDLAHMSPLQAV